MTNSNSNSNSNSNNETNTKKSFDVKDCVAFVTGANKKDGIGRAFVDALLSQKEGGGGGAKKVYATARNVHQLDELVQ
jgi:NAD(P)-dependent dehydrogenase (short-subunit alcohol dehydrogenase family)